MCHNEKSRPLLVQETAQNSCQCELASKNSLSRPHAGRQMPIALTSGGLGYE